MTTQREYEKIEADERAQLDHIARVNDRLKLTTNMTLNTETGQVSRTPKKITIEFFDPHNHMNRCIIDRADRYTMAELETLAEIQRMTGRSEMKIRREEV